MSVRLPIYTYLGVDGYQMYPGTPEEPGIHHDLTPGLHLIAGVNGLGKSTLLLILYHGLVGPAAIRNDDFGVPMPDVVSRRDAERFRRRVADGAVDAVATIHFEIGESRFVVVRSLNDLSLREWSLNGASQVLDDTVYMRAISGAMNVGSFADVLTILNLIIFMFESRGLLMWTPLAQRNALRALFMSPADANELAQRAQAVATANSAYRNLLYIANKDRRQLDKDRAALAAADALSAEYHTLQRGISALDESLDKLTLERIELDQSRTDARAAAENAKYNYDDVLREIEALKLARVASEFPQADEASRFVLARLIGDKECLACGTEDGPLIERWVASVAHGDCLICGAAPQAQEVIVPPIAVDAARAAKAEQRLEKAREALATASADAAVAAQKYDTTQGEIDVIRRDKSSLENRARQIAGSLPPSPPAVAALEEKVRKQTETLEALKLTQSNAELEFSQVFDRFRISIEQKADAIRDRFSSKISDFLVEKAEISLAYVRSPIGESGQVYDWPTFQLSMTSGTFDAPAPRRTRSEVSMSQGEFIDLAFRLALVSVASEQGPASMIFDAPEASLDALFMRRAGAFLAKFTSENSRNRLIVTSNLTNADMIPALFGAYDPQEGDPQPNPVPRNERRRRVIDLLELAAPTSAVALVGDRYRNLLDKALFPPAGHGTPGL